MKAIKLKPKTITTAFITITIGLIAIANGCKAPASITAKTGAQLWAENCNRCHNAPSPSIYSDAQWEVVGEHMRIRADLTNQEVKKIVAFLKASN